MRAPPQRWVEVKPKKEVRRTETWRGQQEVMTSLRCVDIPGTTCGRRETCFGTLGGSQLFSFPKIRYVWVYTCCVRAWAVTRSIEPRLYLAEAFTTFLRGKKTSQRIGLFDLVSTKSLVLLGDIHAKPFFRRLKAKVKAFGQYRGVAVFFSRRWNFYWEREGGRTFDGNGHKLHFSPWWFSGRTCADRGYISTAWRGHFEGTRPFSAIPPRKLTSLRSETEMRGKGRLWP